MANGRDVDDGFWDRADAHIKLANSQCSNAGAGKVSASLLYAASRLMLAENLDDHIDHFEKYLSVMRLDA